MFLEWGDAISMAFGGRPIFSPVSAIVASEVDTSLLPTKYENNLRYPFLLPSPEDVMISWMNGCTSDAERDWVLGFHGIPVNVAKNDAFTRVGKRAWNNVLKSKYPKLPIEQIIFSYYSGMIVQGEFETLMKKYGFLKEQIPLLLKTMEPKFDPNIIVGQYLRNGQPRDKYRPLIRRIYGCSNEDADNILDMTNGLPPVQDLIRFAVRDVYNEDAVSRLHLDDEFSQNKDLQIWAAASGLGPVTVTGKDGVSYTRDSVKDYWRSHWVLPAPTQTYEFLHRLRPSRMQQLQQQVPGVTPFSADDLDYYLRSNDYTPPVRKWLAAISFNVMGRIDVRRAFQQDVIKEDEVLEQIKDQGYNDHDSDILLDLAKSLKKKATDAEDEKDNKKRYGAYWQSILNAYRDGSIDRSTAYLALLNTQMEDKESDGKLNAIDVTVKAKTVQLYIKQTRDEFMLGGFDGIAAFEMLVQGGVSALRAEDLVQQWQRQQTRKRKSASTSQLLKWFASGYIDVVNLRDRLNTLGWTGTDVIILIAQANDDRNLVIARAEAAQARTDRQRAMDQDRLIREAKANAAKAVAFAMQQATPATLKRWFNEGIVTLDQVIAALRFYNFTEENILRITEDMLV